MFVFSDKKGQKIDTLTQAIKKVKELNGTKQKPKARQKKLRTSLIQ